MVAWTESFRCCSVSAESMSPSASICGSERRLLVNALRVNSPGPAGRMGSLGVDSVEIEERTAQIMARPPWRWSSSTSSPVCEFGAGKKSTKAPGSRTSSLKELGRYSVLREALRGTGSW